MFDLGNILVPSGLLVVPCSVVKARFDRPGHPGIGDGDFGSSTATGIYQEGCTSVGRITRIRILRFFKAPERPRSVKVDSR
jgi:hypothetical protein